jgi:(2Fe-2S) ferredoxin
VLAGRQLPAVLDDDDGADSDRRHLLDVALAMGCPTRHVFVCENQRPAGGKPSCGARGSTQLTLALSTELARHPELWPEIAITTTGCLGPCFDGPMVVIYPEGVWYAGVTVADVAELVDEHLVAGRPVERLRYRWP